MSFTSDETCENLILRNDAGMLTPVHEPRRTGRLDELTLGWVGNSAIGLTEFSGFTGIFTRPLEDITPLRLHGAQVELMYTPNDEQTATTREVVDVDEGTSKETAIDVETCANLEHAPKKARRTLLPVFNNNTNTWSNVVTGNVQQIQVMGAVFREELVSSSWRAPDETKAARMNRLLAARLLGHAGNFTAWEKFGAAECVWDGLHWKRVVNDA